MLVPDHADRIQLGHQKLRENLHRLSEADVRRMLGNYGRDLRMIRENLSGD